MSFVTGLYRLASEGLSPLVPHLLARRARAGKECRGRLNERFARTLPARPVGPLVWMHGASVGESLMLTGLRKSLSEARTDLSFLLTSQTLTSARLLEGRLPGTSRHQMAPVDTPAIARRFLDHWKPDLAVFGEGEIWPNLLAGLHQRGVPCALINARMTGKSLRSWSNWPATARDVFSAFELILAADNATAAGLTALLGREISSPGNLKAALPPPPCDPRDIATLGETFIGGRRCLVAASTHPGEEDLLGDALQSLAERPATVLAPRHPERGAALAGQLRARGFSVSRRSAVEPVTTQTDILLADTIGELGLWYRLADLVYLGGGHAAGIGGHNPVEPVQLGRRVVTGPLTHNFAVMMAQLQASGMVCIARDGPQLVTALADGLAGRLPAIDSVALDAFLAQGRRPLDVTKDALLALLPACKGRKARA